MEARRIFPIIAVVGGIFYFIFPQFLQASHGNHLVISEVQITGGAGATTNDFVEIYNPTGAAVDLDGIRLVKRTKTGTSDTTLKSWTESVLVPAHGYYLWANSGFVDIGVSPDASTTGTIAADNGVALRLGPENTGEIIDAVGWGAAENIFVEGNVFATNPGANESIERLPGGIDGNGLDTNDNSADFILRASADPQNSLSLPHPGLPTLEPDPDSILDPDPAPDPVLTPTFSAGDAVVNEFVPNPLDGIEWIEIYNKTQSAIDLAGWKIYDGTGNSIKTLSGTLGAQGYLVFEISSARLNNAGDIIELKAPDGTLIDKVSYGDWDDGEVADNAPAQTKAGQSVARKTNGGDTDVDNIDFTLSNSPTKGESNVITVVETITQGGNSMVNAPTTVGKAKVVINEFVADPEDGEEWIELFNSGEVSVDLDGWFIEEGAERKTKLTGTFIPGQFKVVEKIAGNLNNKGDIIRLKNAAGEMVDKVTYGIWEDGTPSDNAPAAPDPYSVARLKDGVDTNVDKNDFAVTSKVTKGKPNAIIAAEEKEKKTSPSPQSSPFKEEEVTKNPSPLGRGEGEGLPDVFGKLFISEFIPNPEGSDDLEWIELFWAGESELDLTGFSIDDMEGGSRPYKISDIKIASQSYVVLHKEKTRLTLNNTYDLVRLFNIDGTLVYEVEYEGSIAGYSYAKDENGKWFWTTPTPGSANVFDAQAVEKTDEVEATPKTTKAPKVTQVVGLEEVRDLKAGAQAQTQGVVAVLPGVFSSQYFYIVEGNAGAQVYSFKKDFPDLKIGDRVRVSGEISLPGGQARVKTKTRADIVPFSSGGVLEPFEASADMLGEDLEGALVKIAGIIIDATRNGWILDDGSAEAVLNIKPGTEINLSEITPGTKVAVTGIVEQSTSGYRVLPRAQEDIEILGRDPLVLGATDKAQESSNDFPYAKTTGYSLGGAALAAAGVRRRKLFVSGARAIWFVAKKGIGKSGDV